MSISPNSTKPLSCFTNVPETTTFVVTARRSEGQVVLSPASNNTTDWTEATTRYCSRREIPVCGTHYMGSIRVSSPLCNGLDT